MRALFCRVLKLALVKIPVCIFIADEDERQKVA